MNEQECLAKMIAPGTPRPGKYRQGVIQIHVTRSCDKACFHCTQGSNLRGRATFITPEQFEAAVLSLRGYFGVVGVFGGNPAIHPCFEELCTILRKHVPFNQRGLWCNSPLGNGRVMRETFDPSVSNLNVHLDRDAYDEFKRDWPECSPVGLTQDSRHSPPFVAMKDVLRRQCHGCQYCNAHGTAWEYDEECDGSGWIYDEEQAWSLISDCDINKHWSAMIATFRGQLRAWFCEIAGAQSILHQDEPDYPDTGLDPTQRYFYGSPYGDEPRLYWAGPQDERPEYGPWWQLPMVSFREQVRKHCHECGIPLRGYGQLAQADDTHAEQVSETHRNVYRPKRVGRAVELVTVREQLHEGRIGTVTKYLQNAAK